MTAINAVFVEDNDLFADYMKAAFEHYNSKDPSLYLCYIRVCSIAAAIEYIDKERAKQKARIGEFGTATQVGVETVDVILFDLNLPNGRGESSFVRLFAACSDIPIVILTGDEDRELETKVIKSGAQDYIRKSTLRSANEIEDLVRRLHHAILRHRVEMENNPKWQALQEKINAVREAAKVICSKK